MSKIDKNREKISILLAPAFKTNYPEDYERVLGGLKNLAAATEEIAASSNVILSAANSVKSTLEQL